MKLTLNWLAQYVDFNWSPEELKERLTMLGLEVEGMTKLGGEFEGVVVAQVITRDKHPNADKLSVCRVNDGKGERQIVCGAQNFQAGDKVPLILPGATLPPKAGDTAPFTIKVGKIRGVESHGMMCSPQELGLPDEVDGLLILPADAKVGQPFAEHLGRAGSDVIYDLEVTPNRPDLNSVIGIAREISALTGNPLRLPSTTISKTSAEPIGKSLQVKIEEPELCPRYVARLVRNVKVGPSPAWMKSILEKVGLRSINNVVDITNFVMLETGQPLHAFDLALIQAKAGADGSIPTIVVRRASEGEKFTTLDGKEHTLSANALLIADENRGVALAGIMGGQNSEINASTSNVLLESASFKPQNIRATSKKLDLRTDASYRFERGSDVGACNVASLRAAQLMAEYAGGEALAESIDAYPGEKPAAEITLRASRTDALLGIALPLEEQTRHLKSLGLQILPCSGAGTVSVKVPTWRVDLKREADLIEEIARLHGVDKIPSTPPRGALGSHAFDSVFDQYAEVRRILTGLGLSEAQGQTLISDVSAKQAVGEAGFANVVALENPLSSDMNVLRPSLLPGLLAALSHNAHHRNADVALFEIGRVFIKNGVKAAEERRVAIALTGLRNPLFWSGAERDAKADFSDLKGIVEELFEVLGLRGLVWTRRESPAGLFIESGTVTLGKLTLGELGQLSPQAGRKLDLRDPVLLAEFNLDLLLARRAAGKGFKPLPSFPSSRRDIALLVPETTTHDAVLAAIKQSKPANIEGVELFDIFRGTNVPEGKKSVAYALTYRHAERTLTDAEVTAAHDKLVADLKLKLGAELR